MSNMSYCRFENTTDDLQDCMEALERLFSGGCDEDHDYALSNSEFKAAKRLVELCAGVVDMAMQYNQNVCGWDDVPTSDLLDSLAAAQAEAVEKDRKRDEREDEEEDN